MPKSSKQRIGEIVVALRRYLGATITQEEFADTLSAHGVDSKSGVREYAAKMESRGYIARVQGGFQLTESSWRDAVVKIRVSPAQNKGEVIRGLTAALQQFQPLTTMEIEE